ncbi:MAG: uroporphyrinogen decarboxylase family protein [Candidatus Lokiarchaeia archaeon]
MSWRDELIDEEIDFLAKKIRMRAESEEMTPIQRYANVVLGIEPDRLPVFAFSVEWTAHWLGYQLNKDFAYDYKKWVHTTLAGVDRTSADMCSCGYDIYNIGPDAMGAEIKFPEDAIPEIVKPAVKTPDDLANLKIPDPHKDGRNPLLLKALKLVKEKIGDIVPIMAMVNGPFSWAASLRGIYDYLADLKRNPKFAKDLLEIVTDAVIEYTKAELELGLTPIIMADALASKYVLSPKQIEEYCIWSYRKIEDAIGKQNFMGSPLGDLEDQKRFMEMDIGVPALGLTNYGFCDRTGTDPLNEEDILNQKKLARELGCLNLVNLWGQWVQVHSPREIEEEVKRIIKLAGPELPFMVGIWYIPLGTPVENIDAFVRAIKKYGKFPLQL